MIFIHFICAIDTKKCSFGWSWIWDIDHQTSFVREKKNLLNRVDSSFILRNIWNLGHFNGTNLFKSDCWLLFGLLFRLIAKARTKFLSHLQVWRVLKLGKLAALIWQRHRRNKISMQCLSDFLKYVSWILQYLTDCVRLSTAVFSRKKSNKSRGKCSWIPVSGLFRHLDFINSGKWFCAQLASF